MKKYKNMYIVCTALGNDLQCSLKSVSSIEMPKSYHRNADEMLFKTDNVCQKTNAKYRMLKHTRQKSNAKEMYT